MRLSIKKHSGAAMNKRPDPAAVKALRVASWAAFFLLALNLLIA